MIRLTRATSRAGSSARPKCIRMAWTFGAGLGLGLLALNLPGVARADVSPEAHLDLSANRQTSSKPITTEDIAQIDPAQPNPQLRRWVLGRKVSILGWVSRKLPHKRVGVRGGRISSLTTVYLRPNGPWYDTLRQFPCSEKSFDPVFATQPGTRANAAAAAKLWDNLLSKRKLKLALLLSKVNAEDEHSAWSKADRIFREWLVRLDREWRSDVKFEIEAKQWKEDLKEAQDSGFCKGMRKTPLTAQAFPTSPEVWMANEEPQSNLATPSPSREKPLTRAPSRRWNGLFAVLVDVGVGDSSALGQMLIDPATEQSVLSPDWLISQGVRPEWLEIPEADPVHVHIVAGSGQSGLGAVAQVGYAKMSGYPLSLNRFVLFDTSIFDEPESPSPCCSGVLGSNFLHRYVVEFQAGKPTAVQLWPIATYRAPAGYQWVEVRENDDGKLHAVCSGRVKALLGAAKLCQDPRRALMTASATLVYDLPHGRIWYSPKELNAPLYQNNTGVRLNFTFFKGNRVLEVKSLGKTSMAKELKKDGLKPGMIVTKIDGISADDMDQWEVNRRLSGVYGKTVTITWKTRKGYKAEPLHLLGRTLKNSTSS